MNIHRRPTTASEIMDSRPGGAAKKGDWIILRVLNRTHPPEKAAMALLFVPGTNHDDCSSPPEADL